MNVPEQSQPATTWAAVLGFLAVAGGALIRMFTRKQKEAHDNDASLEEIRNKGIIELLNDYRQQVSNLRAEILAMSVRHAQAMKDADARYAVLEADHEKVLQDLFMVRAQLNALQLRMDGE